MAATLKTDVVGNKTDTTANLTLGSSGATTFGGAVTVTSGTINGTTIGASTATAGNFTNVIATEIKATSGQTLSLKEDSGTAIITIPTDGSVELLPASTTSVTLGKNSTNEIVAPTGHGQDRHTGESVELNAKVTGVGYRSGSTSSSTAKSVGAMYAGITGEIKMYGGQYEPEGWVFCDGSAYDGGSSTAYKNLYDVLQTTYGNGGGGSNMFNVPDMRGRVPMGVGTGRGKDSADTNGGSDPATASATTLTARERGEFGGFESVTLTAGESGVKAHTHPTSGISGTVAAHNHDLSNHVHSLFEAVGGVGRAHVEAPYASDASASDSGGNTSAPEPNITGGASANGVTISGTVPVNTAAGAADAHSNEMPFMCVNYIIKL